MSEHTLSVVLLIPSEHRDAINAVAEALDHGPNNMSVPLLDALGVEWYGCHAWAAPEFLEQLAAPPAELAQVPGAPDALSALVYSAREGAAPREHWLDALAVNGLSEVSGDVA